VDSEVASAVAVGAIEANANIFVFAELGAGDGGFCGPEKRGMRVSLESGLSHGGGG